MNSIIHYLLKQFAFDDSNSPDYQKFKTGKLPHVLKREVWHYTDISYNDCELCQNCCLIS